MQKFIFIFTYDTYVRAILPIVRFARAQHIDCAFYLYDLGAGDLQISKSKAQLLEVTSIVTPIKNIHDVLRLDEINNSDAIFFGFGGRPLKSALRYFHDISAQKERRPMSITLSPGIRTVGQYDGFAARALSDLMLLNNADDAAEYHQYCDAAGVAPDNAYIFGMPSFDMYARYKRSEARTIKNVYFVEQTTVPKTQKDKIYIAQKLMDYARRYPARIVSILMKNAPDRETAHQTAHNLERIFNDIKTRTAIEIPDNIRFVYDGAECLFKHADLCLSVSSTVALECVYLGIPAIVIDDFGFSYGLGNSHFERSGLALCFDDIIDDVLPIIDPVWNKSHVMGCADHMQGLFLRIGSHNNRDVSDTDILAQRKRVMAYLGRLKMKTYPWPRRIYKYIKRALER